MYAHMKLQDLYPYDSALFGLNHQYAAMTDKSFLINYSSIVAPGHVVLTGQTYMLFNHRGDGSIDNRIVRLVDVYNDNVSINLVLYDILKRNSFIVQLNVHENQCSWILADISFIRDEIERFIVKRYCNCAD